MAHVNNHTTRSGGVEVDRPESDLAMGRKPLQSGMKKTRRFQVLVTEAEGNAVMEAVQAGEAQTASEYFRQAAIEKLRKSSKQ